MNTTVLLGTSTLNNLPVFLDLSRIAEFSYFGNIFMDEDQVLHSNARNYTSGFELFSAINEAVRDIQIDDVTSLCNLIVVMNKARFAKDVFGFDEKIESLMVEIANQIDKLV
jgi:hypothetical protein